jgi:2-polyprenyl-3-methyl-5-hydroxy-6-metoxy-1,4-benzoquinol methylase
MAEHFELSPEAEQELYPFKKNLPNRIRLQEIVRSSGRFENQDCLEIGASSGPFSYHLRRMGGQWESVSGTEAAARQVQPFVAGQVHVMDGATLPFKKKGEFDIIIVMDMLETLTEGEAFIEECHNLLKPGGRLIVSVRNRKAWSLIASLRHLLGLEPPANQMREKGYTEADLFYLLKDGFDVMQVRTYSRFFVELTQAFVQFFERRTRAGGETTQTAKKIRRLHRTAGFIYELAYQLDLLLFFNRGNSMIAMAKRRAWHPRKTPVLVDGRSISEAVLSKAAD